MKFKNVPRGHAADPFEAFRQLVYLAGVQELAPQMGLKPGTLYNKADADEDTHHQPSLRDVVLATRLTGDMRVIEALDAHFDRASFDLAHLSEVSDQALLELLASLGAEIGQFHSAFLGALNEKEFTAYDLSSIKSEALDVVGALMKLVKRLEGLVDE